MGLFNKKVDSTKIGRVRRCPQCGANVTSSKVICPECGWEFDEANAHGALNQLSEEINKSKRFFSGKSEADVVSSFPITKTKADLLDLIIFFKSKVDNFSIGKDIDHELCKVYKQKYRECILKAEQFYSSDPAFAKLISEYHKQKKLKIILFVTLGLISITTMILLHIYGVI